MPRGCRFEGRRFRVFRGIGDGTHYGPAPVPYATVTRPAGTYRRMLTAPDTLEAVIAGKLPLYGARILMETYNRPSKVGTVSHKLRSGDRWEYGSFPVARPDLAISSRASCLFCHVGAAETDLTYTGPSLDRVGAGAAEEVFSCTRRGRLPCAPAIYAEGG